MNSLSTAYQILKLNDLYEHQALMFIFDYITNKFPLSLCGTFQFNQDYLDLCPTRQSNMINIIRCSTQVARRFTLSAFPEMWNKQSRSLRNVKQVISFPIQIPN